MTTREPQYALPLRDVLKQTIRAEHFLGQGKGARAYRFAEDTGLSSYILRVEEQNLNVDDPEFETKAIGALDKAQHFSASKKNAVGESIGQEFLSFKSEPFHFSVRALQPGQSLKSIYERSRQIRMSRLEHATQLMERFFSAHEGREDNPLTALMATVLKLANSGFEPDTNPANVLFNAVDGRFSLVDQCVRRIQPSAQNSAKFLHDSAQKLKQYVTFEKAITAEKDNPENAARDSDVYAKHALLTERFNALVDDAVAQVKQNIGSKEKMAFAKVESVSVIPLDRPTHVLRDALRALDTRGFAER